MAKKFGPPKVKCSTCAKTVYPLEALNVQDQTFHKRCFRCSHCDNVCSLGSFAMYQGTVYCKPHFLALFRERGTYNFSAENGDPTAPAFGCKRQQSADSNPSTTSEVATEKIVKKSVVKPKDDSEEAAANPYDHIRLKPTSSNGLSLSRSNSSDEARSNPYDHVQLKPTGSLSPSQSSSSDNFSQQESKPTPNLQLSEDVSTGVSSLSPSQSSSSDIQETKPSPNLQLSEDVSTGVTGLSPSQSSSSDNFSQQESEPTLSIQLNEVDLKAGADNTDEDGEMGKCLAGDDVLKKFPTITSSKSATSVESLISAIRGGKNNDVKKAISGQGVELLLEKGADGKTPIEYAFASENVECGRFLIDVLQSEIQNLKTV